MKYFVIFYFFFFQAEDGIRDSSVTGVQTCALPICRITDKRRQERAVAAPVPTMTKDALLEVETRARCAEIAFVESDLGLVVKDGHRRGAAAARQRFQIPCNRRQILFRPAPDTRAQITAQAGRLPSIEQRAGQVLFATFIERLFLHGQPSRGMT